MKYLNFGLKGLIFGLLTAASVHAESTAKGKCVEIESYLKDELIGYQSNIESCTVNDKDEIIELYINNRDLSEENINKILSYNTIEKLYYSIYYGEVYDEDLDEYSPKFKSFPTNLKNLPNLKELHLEYCRKELISHTYTEVYHEYVNENVLKDLKINSLTLEGIVITNSTLEEISSLSNLESLTLMESSLNEISLDKLKNNKKLSTLYIGYYDKNYYSGTHIPNQLNLSNIKTLKKLSIEHIFLNQNIINELANLTFLEELNMNNIYFNDVSGKTQLVLSFDKLSNLSKLVIDFTNSRNYSDEDVVIKTVDLRIPKSLQIFEFNGADITDDNINAISSTTNLKELAVGFGESSKSPDIEKFNNLINLESLKISGYDESNKINVKFNKFNLKKLNLQNILLPDSFEDEVLSLDQLEELSLERCKRDEPLNFDSIGNLKKLNTLIISNEFYEDFYILKNIPISLFELTNIKFLKLNGQNIGIIPEEIGNLKNLETLILTNDEINSEIPQSLNNLKKLKVVYIEGLISGKTLTNDSIESCSYTQTRNLCIAKDMPCLENYELKKCLDADIPISSDGQCGKDHGRCPSNQCCNKDGKCGTGEDYCYISNGCQNKYSYCTDQCDELDMFISKINEESDLYDESETDECKINDNGEIISLKYFNYDNTGKIIEKIASFKSITKFYYSEFDKVNRIKELINLTNLEDLTIILSGVEDEISYSDLNNLKNLKKLTVGQTDLTQKNFDEISNLIYLESLKFSSVGLESSYIKFNFLKKFTNLQSFYFEGREGKPSLEQIPYEIFTLSNLKNLTITNYYQSIITTIPKEIGNLKNLEYLDLSWNQIKSIPKEIGELSNIKVIDLVGNEITNFPSELGNLENLEDLNIGYNEIDDVIPESLNKLKNLRRIYLSGNEKLRGKTLTNPSIKECFYDEDVNVCIAKFMDCMKDELESNKYNYKYCSEIDTTTTTSKSTTTTKESSITSTVENHGKCGKEYGKCGKGYCCSKYGWCGTTSEYCSIIKGCQKEYGICDTTNKTTTTKKSTTIKSTTTKKSSTTNVDNHGKCGEEYGKCGKGYCCSKYGWCGTTSEYCDVTKGCQAKYGLCNTSNKTTTTKISSATASLGKCGKEYGKCAKGYCCSKHGWCGKTSEHCVVAKGCQIEYGLCESKSDSKCGSKNGYKCPSGKCCSRYGYCGTGKDYCGSGCQSEFGDCN